MGAVLSIAALGLAAALGYDREMMLLVTAACVSMTITLVNETAIAGLYGLQRMGRPAVWGVVGQLVAAVLGITAVVMNAGVVVYAFVIAPAFLIPLIANVSSLWPELRRGWWGGRPYLARGFRWWFSVSRDDGHPDRLREHRHGHAAAAGRRCDRRLVRVGLSLDLAPGAPCFHMHARRVPRGSRFAASSRTTSSAVSPTER